MISPEQGWKLAKGWYYDRLDPDWRPKTAPEIRALLKEIALTGDFWKLP